jgi:hypothetical protein
MYNKSMQRQISDEIEAEIAAAESPLAVWWRAFGRFANRKNKTQDQTAWEARRLAEAKAEFPHRKITKEMLRR